MRRRKNYGSLSEWKIARQLAVNWEYILFENYEVWNNIWPMVWYIKSRTTTRSNWSHINYFLTTCFVSLNEALVVWRILWYKSDYYHWWSKLVREPNIEEFYTWKACLLRTAAIGIIYRSLNFCESLRMWMTLEIIFSWAQAFTFGNCCTVDMVTLTSFSTIGGGDWLIGWKCLIVIVTQTS